MTESFGTRLKSLRTAAGISMGTLAKRINYSKSYLSKIENDLKKPTATLARLCDGELRTDGALSALLETSESSPTEEAPEDREVWVMALDENGDIRFHLMDRRQLFSGAGALLGCALVGGGAREVDEATVAALRASFDQYRTLGMISSPRSVLGPVIAHAHTVRSLAEDAPDHLRPALLLLVSRVTEYAGWMSQEAGDENAALWWTQRAVEFAERAGDRQLASYAMVRRAEIALYRQDAAGTIELAQRAQSAPDLSPRIRGLAARCEAQGHALAGAATDFHRALARAAESLARADDTDGAPLLGSSSVIDQVALAEGWALHDLGMPATAAELLDEQVGRIPASGRRARARFGARRALAHATAGEVDWACALTGDVLRDAAYVDSATVRTDLRQLARTLARWRDHEAVRNLSPDLVAALRTRL